MPSSMLVMRQRYLTRKQNGICIRCGTQPSRSGKFTCLRCAKHKSGVYLTRKCSSVCVKCGASARIGKTTCAQCAKRHAKYDQRRDKNKLYDQYKQKQNKLRDAAFAAYGGYKCSCPGCTVTIPQFLVIDHINNDGYQHRKLVGKHIYRWLKNNNYPPGFQVLCANCNTGKMRNGGVCPQYGKGHVDHEHKMVESQIKQMKVYA